MSILSDNIKKIRLNLGDTMEQFGQRFNTSKGTVNNWEKGRNAPNRHNLQAIATLGNMSVNELLHGSNEERILNSFNEFWDRLLEDIAHKKPRRAIYGFVDIDDIKTNIINQRQNIFEYYRENVPLFMIEDWDRFENGRKNNFTHAVEAVSQANLLGGNGIVYAALQNVWARLVMLDSATPSNEYHQALKKLERIIDTEYSHEQKKHSSRTLRRIHKSATDDANNER